MLCAAVSLLLCDVPGVLRGSLVLSICLDGLAPLLTGCAENSLQLGETFVKLIISKTIRPAVFEFAAHVAEHMEDSPLKHPQFGRLVDSFHSDDDIGCGRDSNDGETDSVMVVGENKARAAKDRAVSPKAA